MPVRRRRGGWEKQGKGWCWMEGKWKNCDRRDVTLLCSLIKSLLVRYQRRRVAREGNKTASHSTEREAQVQREKRTQNRFSRRKKGKRITHHPDPWKWAFFSIQSSSQDSLYPFDDFCSNLFFESLFVGGASLFRSFFSYLFGSFFVAWLKSLMLQNSHHVFMICQNL